MPPARWRKWSMRHQRACFHEHLCELASTIATIVCSYSAISATGFGRHRNSTRHRRHSCKAAGDGAQEEAQCSLRSHGSPQPPIYVYIERERQMCVCVCVSSLGMVLFCLRCVVYDLDVLCSWLIVCIAPVLCVTYCVFRGAPLPPLPLCLVWPSKIYFKSASRCSRHQSDC